MGEHLCRIMVKAHVLIGNDVTSRIGTKHAAMQCNPIVYLPEFAERAELLQTVLRKWKRPVRGLVHSLWHRQTRLTNWVSRSKPRSVFSNDMNFLAPFVVKMASKHLSYDCLVNAILETVTIRIFVNMAYISS